MSFQYLLIFLNLNYAPMSTQRVLDMISDYNPRQNKAECFYVKSVAFHPLFVQQESRFIFNFASKLEQ